MLIEYLNFIHLNFYSCLNGLSKYWAQTSICSKGKSGILNLNYLPSFFFFYSFQLNNNVIFSFLQLTEKLSQAESELDQVLLSKDEMEVELEASLTARGAGKNLWLCWIICNNILQYNLSKSNLTVIHSWYYGTWWGVRIPWLEFDSHQVPRDHAMLTLGKLT